MHVVAPLPIAVVLTSFEPGGTERQMIELIRRLSPARWSVHVACLHARGRWAERVAEAATSVAEFPIQSFRSPETCRQALAFSRWCSELRLMLVHTSDLYSNIFALPAAAYARVPVRVANRRGLYLELSSGLRALQRAAFTCAHAIVANSSASATQLRAERVAARKVSIVPNGLDVDSFTVAPLRPLRRQVLTVANLRQEKGHSVLIDAAVHVLKRYPDAHFTLAGDGPERSALQARLTARGINHAFSMLGERDDVQSLLTTADIFVLPSLTESLPNAALEAMAAGLPVVASDVGGVPDLIEHGRTGLLVPPADPRALADQLCAVMSDPLLGTRIGSAARAKVQRQFSFDQMVSTIDGLYSHELAKRGIVRADKAA